nr:hypothetical protein CFP56_68831 [Quercus suber]
MWPKGESVASSLLRLYITTSESPSKIKDEKPSSSPKETAPAAAKASTISDIPTFLMSLNVVPSKLSFREASGGGFHLTRGRALVVPKLIVPC